MKTLKTLGVASLLTVLLSVGVMTDQATKTIRKNY